MRPYIICHMVASIDGRIDSPMVAQISGEGRKGQTALFDGCTWEADAPFHLKLQSVEQISGTDVVWMRYKCK